MDDESEMTDLSAILGPFRGFDSRAGKADKRHSAHLASYRIGRFDLLREVGRGGFGIVYAARDPQLDRTVAVKIARSDTLADDEAIERLQREAKITATLDHPNIVPVYETGEADAGFGESVVYIVSQFCEGSDLRHWLKKHAGELTPVQCAQLVTQLATALQYAHSKGVLHRDVKPGNVMLPPATIEDSALPFLPRLTDFGMASMQSADWTNTRTSMMIGTPSYMPPECFGRGAQPWTAAGDIYSLGAVLYIMLTGQPPIDGETFGQLMDRIANHQPTPAHEVDALVPLDLSIICDKCLAKDAEDRYATAGALADDLNRFAQGQPIHARPITWRDRFRKWCQQPRRISFAGKYSCWFHLLIMGWMLMQAVVALGWNLLPGEQLVRSLIDIVIVSTTLHLPKVWLGWRVASASRWAFWPSLLMSLVCTTIFVVSAFSSSVAFDYNYPTALTKLSVFVPLIVASAVESGAYLVAVPAFLRGWRNA